MLLESYFHMFSVVLYSHDTLATPPEVKDGARQCDNVSPPCILGDDYRNPPNADALDILAKTKIHAKDDCGEVKGEHAKEMRVATHFVKKTGVKVRPSLFGVVHKVLPVFWGVIERLLSRVSRILGPERHQLLPKE